MVNTAGDVIKAHVLSSCMIIIRAIGAMIKLQNQVIHVSGTHPEFTEGCVWVRRYRIFKESGGGSRANVLASGLRVPPSGRTRDGGSVFSVLNETDLAFVFRFWCKDRP